MDLDSPPPQLWTADSLRRDFPLLERTLEHGPYAPAPLTYLDSAASTPCPRPVVQRMVDVYGRSYANVHRGSHRLAEEITGLYEGAREKVRQFLNARSAHEIVFTSGTTHAINLVARAWGDARLTRGDEIVLTEMEHHSNLVPWLQLAQRKSVVLKYVPVTDDGRLDLDALDRLLTPRTKLVAITAVSNVLGTINPVSEIARRVHSQRTLLLVDAAQAAPRMPIDVAAWDVDFLAFSGHKMLAPTGIGVLYARRSLLESMPAYFGGGNMVRHVTRDDFETHELPCKFEAGTPPIVQAIALDAAIDYLTTLRLEAIADHERRLTEYAHERLRAVSGLTILGPTPVFKTGIVSFNLAGLDHHAVARQLDAHGMAVRSGCQCARPLHRRFGLTGSVRASFYVYTTRADVDRLADALLDRGPP